MATIEVTKTPYLLGPNPVGNCIEFCFEIDEFLLEDGIKARACIVFQGDRVSFQQGDEITFLNQTVIAGTGPGELNLLGDNNQQNAEIMERWLRATYPININTDISVLTFGTFSVVCVEWCEYGPIEDFIFDWPPPVQAAVTLEGVTPESPEGFKFVYQLLCLDENKEKPKPICPMQQRPVSVNEDGTPQPICLELQNELSNQVYTEVPKCDDGLIINEPMTKWVQLMYSYVERNPETNCGVVYAPFEYTDPLLIINQAINLEDGENAASLYRLEGNLGEIKFLTSRDTSDIRVCLGDCDWLFVPAFFNEFNAFPVTYSARYETFRSDGSQLASFAVPYDAEEGVLQIPAGPQSILSAYFPAGATFNPDMCRYTIQLNIIFAGTETPYSEVATFRVDQNCCCDTNIFYLDPKGGYSRMGFECIENQNFVDTGTEVCLDVPCGDYESEMMSGKSRVDSEGYTTMTLVTPKMKKTDATMCELRAFKSSEKKYYIFTDKQGGKTNRRVTTVPGTTRIMEKDGKVTLTITVIESQNYKVISER